MELIEKQIVKVLMIKYGFTAPDMTVTELVEDILQSAQPEPCEDTVSRKKVIDALVKESQADGAYGYMDTKSIVDLLNDLPPAQPEIVRCKDCKYRTSYWGNCRLLEEKYHQSVLVDGDSFCSMAERRTDGRD